MNTFIVDALKWYCRRTMGQHECSGLELYINITKADHKQYTEMVSTNNALRNPIINLTGSHRYYASILLKTCLYVNVTKTFKQSANITCRK